MDEVEGLVARLKESDAKKVLKAQEQIAEVFERDIKPKQFEPLLKKIKRSVKDSPADSAVGRDAAKALKRLREIRDKKQPQGLRRRFPRRRVVATPLTLWRTLRRKRG